MQEPSSVIEFNISCKNLISLDALSKSDPFVVTFLLDPIVAPDYKEIGQTETLKDDPNPKFTKSVITSYFFERNQKLKFAVWDYDKSKNHDLIGEMECSIGEIVGSRGQCIQKEIVNHKHQSRKNGTIIIYAEEVNKGLMYTMHNNTNTNTNFPASVEETEALIKKTPTEVVIGEEPSLEIDCHGVKLDKKDFFGKSDPYFKIFRTREDNELVCVHQSEIIKKTLNPQWNSFYISEQKICNNDRLRPILFEVWDWDRLTSHDLIGKFTTSVEALLKGNLEHKVIHPDKKKKKPTYDCSGTLVFKVTAKQVPIMGPNPELARLREHRNRLLIAKGIVPVPNPFTFMEYLAGGCEVSVVFGIDFTSSNGWPDKESSLHYLFENKLNSYEEAIKAVGSIVAPYDRDNMFPVFGYGAKINETGVFPPVFPINLNEDKPECFGVDGILRGYRDIVPIITFGDMGTATRPDGKPYYGDDFYQLIQKTMSTIGKGCKQATQKYHILVLIIDGDAFDEQATIDTIVDAEDYPLSIIIIGVGFGGFANSIKFDADDTPLKKSNGRVQKRDIVQFVRFEDYKHSMDQLSAAVLAEVPKQLTSFMAMQNIMPNQKIV